MINVIETSDIKVLTSIRRSGKSKLLDELKKYIMNNVDNFNIKKYNNLKNVKISIIILRNIKK